MLLSLSKKGEEVIKKKIKVKKKFHHPERACLAKGRRGENLFLLTSHRAWKGVDPEESMGVFHWDTLAGGDDSEMASEPERSGQSRVRPGFG